MTAHLKFSAAIAWGLCVIAWVLALMDVVPFLIQHGQSENILQLAGDLSWKLLIMPFAITAALIVSRKPGNVIGWLLMIPVVLSIISAPLNNLLNIPAPPSHPGFLFLLAIWFSNWDWLALIFPLILIALLFPTGRPPSPRWRGVLVLAAGLCIIFIFVSTFVKELQPIEENWSVPNPIGFLDNSAVEAFIGVWVAGLAAMTILSLSSLFVRYRSAGSLERKQIKWLLYACGLFAVIYVPGLWINSLSSGENTFAANLFNALLGLAILTFPASIAISILYYRLWDIDILIRRTLIYSVLSAGLGSFYFGSVLALQLAFRAMTGNTSPVAIVISTLAIAALFAPLRKGVQNFIDRRFYRQKYDTARTLEEFSAAARSEVEIEVLSSHLVGVVERTVHPDGVWVWIRHEKQEK
jgi:hypothetical protein